MIKSIFDLTIMQFKVFFREPGVLFWVFVFPILIATALGLAFDKQGGAEVFIANIGELEWLEKVENFSGVDGQEGKISFQTDTGEQANFRFLKAEQNEALRMLKRGKVSMLLEQNGNRFIFHLDPMNSEARLAFLLLKPVLKALGVEVSVERLDAIGNRYIDYLIPGLMALGVMNSCIWGIGWTLIEYRMKKLLRRMVATPMRKSALMLSSFLNRLLLNLFEMFVLLVFAILFFDVHLQGGIITLLWILITGNAAFAGIAILMSSRTQSTIVGNGLINAITLPMMVLSGVFFSYQNFPEWSIPIIELLPLTILTNGIRAVFLEGAGFMELLPQGLAMIGIGLLTATVGIRVYRWH